jgi:NitT/TauT family transport system ATP-binding protein
VIGERVNGIAQPSLVLREVRVVYAPQPPARDSGLVAIQEVSQQIAEGEFVTVIGPSGCGKTSLAEVVAGLRKASGGSVLVRGEPIHGPHPAVGIVLQEESTFPWRTVCENVEFGLELRGAPRAERRKRALEVIRLVGLSGFENAYPDALSGGMRQRVALARALVCDPDILVMDEPFASLDQQTRAYLGAELLRIWEVSRKTVLFITHDINEAVLLSDRVWVMSSRPSSIRAVVDIDIPRPRGLDTITTPRFNALTNVLWEHLRLESARQMTASEESHVK